MMFQESTRKTGKTWKLYQKMVQHKNVHLTLSQKKNRQIFTNTAIASLPATFAQNCANKIFRR